MSIDLSQFHQAFFAESVEHLEEMERRLLELNVDDPDPEDLNAIFRAAHSIKGMAGDIGAQQVAAKARAMDAKMREAEPVTLAEVAELEALFASLRERIAVWLDDRNNAAGE